MLPLFLLLLCANTTTGNTDTPQLPYIIYPPPITIYNNTNVDQTSTTSSKQADTWSLIPESVRSSLSDLSLDKIQTNCCNFFYKNKMNIVGLGACSSYGAAYLKTLSARNYLVQDNLWSNWKRELSTQTLLYMSEHALAQDLTFEIQQRYLNSENPTDFLSPLVQFLKEIKEETETIQACKTLYKWLKYTYLSQILILDISSFKRIDEQLQRIRYLHHIFQRWIAQQNIAMHTTKNKQPTTIID